MAEDCFASLLEEVSSLVSGRILPSCNQAPPYLDSYAGAQNGTAGTAAVLGRGSLSRTAPPTAAELASFAAGADDIGAVRGTDTAAVAVTLPTEYMPPDVGQSLPELASELLQAQSSQHKEVACKEEILKELQVELQKEKEHLQSIKRDVCAASKSICLAQDRAAQVGLECGTLEKETAALVHEIQGLREELEETRRKTEEEYKLVRECREKMDRHRSRTDAAEQACPIQQELEGLRMAIDDLKDRRGSYMQDEGLLILSGERQRQLQELITAAEGNRVAMVEQNRELQNQVHAGSQHLTQVKREVDVSKKRHQAQVTRLHRQVQEAQARRRQWGEEADCLKAAIAQLKQKIEE